MVPTLETSEISLESLLALNTSAENKKPVKLSSHVKKLLRLLSLCM